ncbi:hypothetical protein [Streptomyces sp. NPDC093097]|uniref:hypothetical protein n=1 Tax=Streptomyces sp. NPDC093097 TaxID=3366027 RepID=UPI003805802E
MTSMQPLAAGGHGPRLPKAVAVALAAGYVAGYTAAFGVVDMRQAIAGAASGVAAWLVWQRRR